MSIKLIGALLILISGGSIGWLIGSQYLNRVRELKGLQTALHIFEVEISYGQTVLPEALRVSAAALNNPLARLFLETADSLKNSGGETFNEIWQKQLERNYHSNSLLRGDLEIISQWGEQVGRTSLANQSKTNLMTIKRLEHAEQRAEEIAGKRVKLVRYAGVLISLLVIILFY